MDLKISHICWTQNHWSVDLRIIHMYSLDLKSFICWPQNHSCHNHVLISKLFICCLQNYSSVDLKIIQRGTSLKNVFQNNFFRHSRVDSQTSYLIQNRPSKRVEIQSNTWWVSNTRLYRCGWGAQPTLDYRWIYSDTHRSENTVQSCNSLFDSHPVAVLMFDRTDTQCTTPKGWRLGWATCSRSIIIEY